MRQNFDIFPSRRSTQRLLALASLVLVAALTASSAFGQQGPATPKAGPRAIPPLPPVAPPTVEGLWIDHTGRGAVEVVRCGPQLCGRIAWLANPNDKKGRPLRDGLNPEPARRAQTICGLQIIGELKPMRGGVWDEGWIYDPEKGERFSVELQLKGPDTLQVMGYLGIKLLSETYLWRRAAADTPRCTPGA